MALEHLPCRVYCLLDELAVALEVGEEQQRLAALPLTEIFAWAAQVQVALGDLEPVGALEDDLQSRAGSLGERVAKKQDAHALAHASANAAAQLVQLREAEALGALNNHQGSVRYVHADLDHRGAYKKLDLSGDEALHNGRALRGRQPSVQQTDLKRRQLTAQALVGLDRGLHALLRVLDHRTNPVGLLAFGT